MSSIGLLTFLSRTHVLLLCMRPRIGYLTDAVGSDQAGGCLLESYERYSCTGSILEVRRGGVIVSQERNAVVVEQYS